MGKHIHADLMAQYAKDAQETERPWERWQNKHEGDGEWNDCSYFITWSDTAKYRRKPSTRTVYEWRYQMSTGDWVISDALCNEEEAARYWTSAHVKTGRSFEVSDEVPEDEDEDVD